MEDCDACHERQRNMTVAPETAPVVPDDYIGNQVGIALVTRKCVAPP